MKEKLYSIKKNSNRSDAWKSFKISKQHAEVALQKTKNLKPPVFDFGGHWKNELGSYMDLTVDGNNNVTGKYVSAVSGTGGPIPSTDLRGTVTGDLIAFTVNWGSAITTWAGHETFLPSSSLFH